MRVRRYDSIKAWQVADRLAIAVYRLTTTFPREEVYGLTSQMRRAGVSVAANIAEGANRTSRKEYLQFLAIARGSLAELRYYVHVARELTYLNVEQWEQLDGLCDEGGRLLHGLMNSIEHMVQLDAVWEKHPLESGV